MGNRRGESCYRTESYAGMPRGSYLNPNPKHFHIPQKASAHATVQTQPNPAKSADPEPADSCFYFATDNKLVKLDISLQVVKEFIEPINSALHPTTSVSCQTECNESVSPDCDKFDEKTMFKSVDSRLSFDITRDNESYFDVSLCCSSVELTENPEMKLFSRCSSVFGEIVDTAIDSGLCEEVNTLRDGSNTENLKEDAKENFEKDENQNDTVNIETDKEQNEIGLLNVDTDLININIDKEFDSKHSEIVEEDVEQFVYDLISNLFNDISSEHSDDESKNEVELTENLNHNILSELQDVTSNLKITSDDLKILTSDLKTSIDDLKNVSEDIKRTVNIDKTISDITVDYEQVFNDNLDANSDVNSSAEVEIETTLCDYVQNDVGYQEFRQNLNEYFSLYTNKFSKLSDMLSTAIFDFIKTVCVETIDSLELPHFRCYHGAPHLFDILLNIFQPFSQFFDKPYKRSKLVKKIQHTLMHKMMDEIFLETDQTDNILIFKLATVKKFISIVMYIHFSNFDWPDLQCAHTTNMLSYESTSDLDLSFQSTPDQSKYYSSFFMQDTDETLVRKPGDGASDVYSLYDRVKTVNDDDSTTGFLHKKNDRNIKYWVTVDFTRKRSQSVPCISDETLDCKRRYSLPVLDTKRSLSPIYEESVQPVKFNTDSENDTNSCSTSNLSTLKCETGRKIYYKQEVTFVPKKRMKLDNTSDDVSSDIFNETFEFEQDSDSDVDWMGYEAAKF